MIPGNINLISLRFDVNYCSNVERKIQLLKKSYSLVELREKQVTWFLEVMAKYGMITIHHIAIIHGLQILTGKLVQLYTTHTRPWTENKSQEPVREYI
jgi:hypothetical protein